MSEVQFTVEEAAKILELGHETVLRIIRDDSKLPPGDPRRFPRVYMPYNSRKHGYRIPAGDLLEYAESQGAWLVDRVNRAIQERRISDPVRILQTA